MQNKLGTCQIFGADFNEQKYQPSGVGQLRALDIWPYYQAAVRIHSEKTAG